MPEETLTPATGNEPVIETPEPTEPPKPTETVEFWKKQARENEARAKSNADAAQKLQAIEDSQKSEAQKQADATAKAQQDAAEARAEAAAYRVAATHKVTPDYFDLLGTGPEDQITARAERLGALLSAAAENAQLKAENEALRSGKPSPVTSRPIADLKPGATPESFKTDDDLAYEALFGAN